MATKNFSMTSAEIERAKTIWADYQRAHDLADRKGQVAGIDPKTGEIWLGRWFDEIADRRAAEGKSGPLFLARVGSPTALRKGGRR